MAFHFYTMGQKNIMIAMISKAEKGLIKRVERI